MKIMGELGFFLPPQGPGWTQNACFLGGKNPEGWCMEKAQLNHDHLSTNSVSRHCLMSPCRQIHSPGSPENLWVKEILWPRSGMRDRSNFYLRAGVYLALLPHYLTGYRGPVWLVSSLFTFQVKDARDAGGLVQSSKKQCLALNLGVTPPNPVPYDLKTQCSLC